MCRVCVDLFSEGQGARICASYVMLLKYGGVLQLQASGSSREEEGKTLIGHVILRGQELITVGETERCTLTLHCHLLAIWDGGIAFMKLNL